MRLVINLLTVMSFLQLGSSQNTIVDVAVADGRFDTLVVAVKMAGLADKLSGNDKLTVFAPTDAAFGDVKETATKLLMPEWKDHLVDLLTYHVAEGEKKSADLANDMQVSTLNGEKVTIKIDAGNISIEDQSSGTSKVVVKDVAASNGVIHAINRILLPTSATSSIADLATNTPTLSTLLDLLGKAGLAETFTSAGNYTVFAPTNDAFDALPKEDVAWLTDPANKNALANVLKYHVLNSVVTSGNIKAGDVKTLLEQDVTISVESGDVKINKSTVTAKDVLANNGVVHVIDAVLIPEGIIKSPGTIPRVGSGLLFAMMMTVFLCN